MKTALLSCFSSILDVRSSRTFPNPTLCYQYLRYTANSCSIVRVFTAGYKVVDECWNCTAGFHCSIVGRSSPVGPCDPGYYCPPRSSGAREIACPPGMYCVGKNAEPELCPVGTFQPNSTRTSIVDCMNCTAGMWGSVLDYLWWSSCAYSMILRVKMNMFVNLVILRLDIRR